MKSYLYFFQKSKKFLLFSFFVVLLVNLDTLRIIVSFREMNEAPWYASFFGAEGVYFPDNSVFSLLFLLLPLVVIGLGADRLLNQKQVGNLVIHLTRKTHSSLVISYPLYNSILNVIIFSIAFVSNIVFSKLLFSGVNAFQCCTANPAKSTAEDVVFYTSEEMLNQTRNYFGDFTVWPFEHPYTALFIVAVLFLILVFLLSYMISQIALYFDRKYIVYAISYIIFAFTLIVPYGNMLWSFDPFSYVSIDQMVYPPLITYSTLIFFSIIFTVLNYRRRDYIFLKEH